MGVSATTLGNSIGVLGRVMNHLLQQQGFIEGEPGAYRLTEKGEKFGVVTDLDNGYGGWAARQWPVTHYDSSILDELDTSPEAIALAREADQLRRAANATKLAAERAQSELDFEAFQAKLKADNAEYEIDPKKVWLILGGLAVTAGCVFVGVKYGPRMKRAWDEKTVPRLKALKDRVSGKTTGADESGEPQS